MRLAPDLLMSEADYQGRIVEAARLHGWRIHHCRPLQRRDGRWQTPVTGHPGFPDLVLLRGARLLVLEVKTDIGRVTPAEEAWLAAWREVPRAEVHVVRPRYWSLVEEMLR